MEEIMKTIDRIRKISIYGIVCVPLGILLMICCIFFFPLLFVGLVAILISGPFMLYAAIKIVTTDFQNKEVNDLKTLWGILSFIGLGPIAEYIFAGKAKSILSAQGSNQTQVANESTTQGIAVDPSNNNETKAANVQENKITSSPSAGFKPSSDEKFHPVFALWNFLCRITLKKPSTWIVLVVFSILTLGSMLIPLMAFSSDTNYLSLPENIFRQNVVNQFILIPSIIVCLGAGIQGILKTLNIFIDSQKDGTEILIVSKPITRTQIIIARFTYLFMFGIVLSLINMIMVIIGMGIVGMEYYSASDVVIGGTFGASFLSFSVMGIIGALIGLFTDGKVARVLPIVILSFSSAGAMAAGQMMPMLAEPPTVGLQKQIASSIKDQAIGKEVNYCTSTYDDSYYTTTYEVVTAHITNVTVSKYDSFVKYDQATKKIYLDEGRIKFELDVKDNNPYHYNDENEYATINVEVSSLTAIKNISTGAIEPIPSPSLPEKNPANNHDLGSYNSNYSAYVSERVKNYILDIMPFMSAGANPAYVVNYLNPISAFATVMGTTSSRSNAFDFSGIAPNYSINSIKKSPYDVWVKDSYYNNIELNKSYESFDITTSQFDPAWAVALTWVGIFTVASAGTIVGYLRKDFK